MLVMLVINEQEKLLKEILLYIIERNSTLLNVKPVSPHTTSRII